MGTFGPFRGPAIEVVDALRIGVPSREIYHYLQYVLDRRTVLGNRRFIEKMPLEDPPFPSPRMIYRAAGHFSVEQFHRSGLVGAKFIADTLKKNGSNIEAFDKILDFGCGCGRIARHWQNLTGPEVYGCDYQDSLVRWCQQNLVFGRFEQNGLLSPFSYPDRTFSFVYAISVFTHLDEQGQRFWADELSRVLTAKGYFLVTVHGTTRLAELSARELDSFRSGRPIFHQKRYSGSNICAVYHPKTYVEKIFGSAFELADFIPGGARDANQDAYLFRKRGRVSREPSIMLY